MTGEDAPSEAGSSQVSSGHSDFGSESARRERARRLVGCADPGTSAGAALTRLTDLAAQMLGAGSAQISIVTDLQEVLANATFGGGPMSHHVPAEAGLYWRVVRAGAPVVVADAFADPDVALLPAVTSGEIGSYLGVPLIDSDGAVVGALCAFDSKPRVWIDHEVDLLTQLAGLAMSEMQLAAVVSAYEDDRKRWQLAVDFAGVGAFDWDVKTNELRWDDRLLELFGLDWSTFDGTIEAFEAAVHPEDRARVNAALAIAVETSGGFESEYRIVLPGGGLRWISARGHTVIVDGIVTRLLGAAYDTTAVQEGEARIARVLESMPTAYYQLDENWCFIYVNAAAERVLGRSRTELLGESVWKLYPATVDSIFDEQYRRAVETGHLVEFQAHYPAPLNGWYEIRAWPSPGGLAVYFVEVTERVRVTAELAAAAEHNRLTALVADALNETLDSGEILSRIAPLVVPALGDWAVVMAAPDPNDGLCNLEDLHINHADPGRSALVGQYLAARGEELENDPFVLAVLEDQTSHVVSTTFDLLDPSHPATPRDTSVRERLSHLSPATAAFVPLRARGRTAGVLSLYREAGRGPFTDEEVELLGDIGGRIGLGLDNARLYSEQRELAIGLQLSMLTEPPHIDHLEFVCRYVPAADAAAVGGDWYDAFVQHDLQAGVHVTSGAGPGDGAIEQVSDGCATILVIGDVMGHDTRAAAAMGQIRSLLRGAALEGTKGPAELLRSVDRAIVSLGIGTIATAIVARLEQTPAEREAGLTRLRWSTAGHLPPIVIDPDGDVRFLEDASAIFLGTGDDVTRLEAVVTLKRDSTVLLYTDGLIERRNRTIDNGFEHLRNAMSRLIPTVPALEDLCDALLAELLPGRPSDDVALLAVRLHRETPSSR